MLVTRLYGSIFDSFLFRDVLRVVIILSNFLKQGHAENRITSENDWNGSVVWGVLGLSRRWQKWQVGLYVLCMWCYNDHRCVYSIYDLHGCWIFELILLLFSGNRIWLPVFFLADHIGLFALRWWGIVDCCCAVGRRTYLNCKTRHTRKKNHPTSPTSPVFRLQDRSSESRFPYRPQFFKSRKKSRICTSREKTYWKKTVPKLHHKLTEYIGTLIKNLRGRFRGSET